MHKSGFTTAVKDLIGLEMICQTYRYGKAYPIGLSQDGLLGPQSTTVG
jgi:hypothetical protein